MSTTVFGISNCDTVKRARAWLEDHDVAYTFHDFKKQGVPEPELDRWLADSGWETVLNRRGTMWRRLDDNTRNSVVDTISARKALMAYPSLIKRPVVQWPGQPQATVGFDPQAWENLAKVKG